MSKWLAVSPMQKYCLSITTPKLYQSDMNISFSVRFAAGHKSWREYLDCVRRALQKFPVLSVRFKEHDKWLLQKFDSEAGPIAKQTSPLTQLPTDQRSSEAYKAWFLNQGAEEEDGVQFANLLEQEKNNRFYPHQNETCSVRWFRDSAEGLNVVCTFHHAVADVSSFPVLLEQFQRCLETPEEQKPDFSYLRYAHEKWQSWVSLRDDQLGYWSAYLKFPHSEIASDFFSIQAGLRTTIESPWLAVNESDVSNTARFPQMFFLGRFMAALQSHSLNEEGYILSTIENRSSPREKSLFGCVYKHIIWHPDSVDGADSDQERLRCLMRLAAGHYSNRDATLDEICNRFEQETGHCLPLPFAFTYRDLRPLYKSTMDEITVVPFFSGVQVDRMSAHLHVTRTDAGISCALVFDDQWLPKQIAKSILMQVAQHGRETGQPSTKPIPFKAVEGVSGC